MVLAKVLLQADAEAGLDVGACVCEVEDDLSVLGDAEHVKLSIRLHAVLRVRLIFLLVDLDDLERIRLELELNKHQIIIVAGLVLAILVVLLLNDVMRDLLLLATLNQLCLELLGW